jgi:hypothetical protein
VRLNRGGLVLAVLVAMAGVAHAHKPSDAHLRLAVDGAQLTGQLSIAVRDLDGAVDLDTDGNGDITWAETTAAAPRIDAYVMKRITLATGAGPCTMTLGAAALVDLTDGAYWTVPVAAECPSAPGDLTVTYALLFDIDAQHRGIIHVESPGARTTTVVRSSKPVTIAITDPTALMAVIAAGGRALPLVPLLAILALLAGAVRGRRVRPRELADRLVAFVLAEAACALLIEAGDLVLPWSWVEPGLVAVVVIAVVIGVATRRAGDAVVLELGAASGFAVAHAFEVAALPSHAPEVVAEFAVGVALVQLVVGGVAAAAIAWRSRGPATRSASS